MNQSDKMGPIRKIIYGLGVIGFLAIFIIIIFSVFKIGLLMLNGDKYTGVIVSSDRCGRKGSGQMYVIKIDSGKTYETSCKEAAYKKVGQSVTFYVDKSNHNYIIISGFSGVMDDIIIPLGLSAIVLGIAGLLAWALFKNKMLQI